MEEYKVGDKLLCIKDNVEFVYCGCLFNGMGIYGPGCIGDEDHPITIEEIRELSKLNKGTSYYFKFHIKDKIYEIIEDFRGIRYFLTNEGDWSHTIDAKDLDNFFEKIMNYG